MSNENKGICDENIDIGKVEIEKKQWFYEKNSFWIFLCIWIVTVAIGLTTQRFLNDSQLMNALSLFGSISSIILAFLAIIYSYIQTSKQGDAERYMQYTLQRIDKRLDSLNTLNHQLVEYVQTAESYIAELKRMSSALDSIKHETSDLLGSLKESSNSFENLLKNRPESLTDETLSTFLEEQKNLHTSIIALDEQMRRSTKEISERPPIDEIDRTIRRYTRLRVLSAEEGNGREREIDQLADFISRRFSYPKASAERRIRDIVSSSKVRERENRESLLWGLKPEND